MTQTLADILEVIQDTNKTSIMILLMILGTVFRIKGYINGTEFVNLTKNTTIAFFGTAAATNFMSMIKDHLATKIQVLKGQSASVKDTVNEG